MVTIVKLYDLYTSLHKMLTSKREIINCDQQAKFIQDRILVTEKNFSQIYQIFSEYVRKTARVRDKSDEISRIFLTYSETEEINKTLCQGLASFATCFSILGDLGEFKIKKLENKVLSELSQYEGICKNAKEEIKHIFTVREREVTRKRQLDRIRERNPRNRQQITQAETELLRATAEVARTIENLEEQTNDFEKRKLHDLKEVLLNFITSELAFHAKAIEVLTKTYNEINIIDEDSDLQDFQDKRGHLDTELRKTLKSPEKIQNYKSKLKMFRPTQSLGSINTLFSSPKRQLFNSKKTTVVEKSKSNNNVDTISIDNTLSSETETDSESSSEMESTAERFLATKHKQKKNDN